MLYTQLLSRGALLKRDMAVAILPDLRAWRGSRGQANAAVECSVGEKVGDSANHDVTIHACPSVPCGVKGMSGCWRRGTSKTPG